MQDSFYYKVDSHNDIKSIYRLVVDDATESIFELIWLDGRWQPTEGLVGMIMGGEFFLEPVTREVVERVTPYVDSDTFRPE